MTTRATIALGLLLCASAGFAEVTVEQREADAIVRTDAYAATIDTQTGLLTSVTDLDSGRTIELSSPGLALVEERDREEWSKAWTPARTVHRESAATAEVHFNQQGNALRCVSEWTCQAGSVTRTVTFTEGRPVLEINYAVSASSVLEEIGYVLETRDRSLFTRGRIYPADERVLTRRDGMARHEPAPALAHCWDGQFGLGLMVGKDARAVAHAIEPGPDLVQLAAYSPPLRWTQPPFEAGLQVRLVVGADPEQALEIYRTVTPDLSPVEIADLRIDRLIHWTDEPGGATVTLRSHAVETQSVRVDATITGGLGAQSGPPDQTLELAPGAEANVRLQWPAYDEWGYELQVRVLDAEGAELDVAREYFAVSDNFSRVGQIVVFN
ncbi:MAG: hypothetical protein GF393_04325, partial [Armatimonadia bacterium]|nr:hypothetical protein [Armatimonadia bacterium]